MDMVIGLVIVLGVLIFFHELGHFLVARAFNVGVEKFSLGFGPKIIGKTVGRTEYMISAFPLGGYVKLLGEDPDEEVHASDLKYSFTHKPLLQKSLIVAAGPCFNFLLAIVIFFFIFSLSGIIIVKPMVGEIRAGSPAQKAGILPEDTIVSLNGRTISAWSEMSDIISGSKGKPLSIVILRKNNRQTLVVTPEKASLPDLFGQAHDRYVIGVSAAGMTESRPLNPFSALIESLSRTWLIIKLTILSIVKIVQGIVSVKNLGGPIMIAQMAGAQVEAGAIHLLAFIALVSVNLGILNLLPIPVLDGGHILFFAIEGFTGRPVNMGVREKAQQVGLAILIMLMVMVFYNDIMRVVGGG
ncbi:MAG: RIP metalloprotease RseP [Deltaproteobacteria bacterium]|nr:RIP metalloprotease RseP [Deltaproteobacteria bacterium]